MSRLVEFPLDEGGTVLVEITEAGAGTSDGPVVRGLDGGTRVIDQAHQSFEQAIDRVRPAAQALVTRLRTIADPPDELNIRFGLDLHAQAGAFIAETGATANFSVEMTWRRS